MAIYKDCTMVELLVAGGSYLIVGGISLSITTWILFGYGIIGLAITLISLVHVTRLLLGILQRFKYGKPYGYYQQLFFKTLSETDWPSWVWKSKLIIRKDRWSARRENL